MTNKDFVSDCLIDDIQCIKQESPNVADIPLPFLFCDFFLEKFCIKKTDLSNL